MFYVNADVFKLISAYLVNLSIIIFYKLLFLNDRSIITAGPTKTIILSEISWPITCQLIIIYQSFYIYVSIYFIFIYYTLYSVSI